MPSNAELETLYEFDEVILHMEGIRDQISMLHECGANGVVSLDNFTLAIFLVCENMTEYCRQLKAIYEKLRERTK